MNGEQFREVVFTVSQSLRPDESHDIAYINNLPEKFLKARPIEVLMQLEVEQKIYQDNPESLAKVLETVNRHDLAGKVKKAIKTMKKKKNPQNPANISDHLQTLHVELALSKMQIEYATHRIRLLKKNFHHISSTNAINFQSAIDCCSKASQSLTLIQKTLKSESDGSSSDEEPALNSSGSLHSLNSLAKKEKEMYQERMTEECKRHLAPIPLPGLTKECTTRPPSTRHDHYDDIEPRDRTVSVSSMNDSGFVDVSPFLKTKTKPQDNELDDEAIYEELGPAPDERARLQTPVENGDNEGGYMKLTLCNVPKSEYTKINMHTRYLPARFPGQVNKKTCCGTPEGEDEDHLYCEVQYGGIHTS
ncbi:PREDICTED: uncharacterized protein LOC109582843 isoform X2 [Amphimedon queenslandica]|uniref:DED domain-containing protein n=1 Tax=Amphimedon queenslandica TaxID=400682 RepID=A0A1X7UMU4_AMPQE|nr:PREDICTED: uncharacterized protein LOC109582843 isoform X2 [Amphimedon queenslandica]|eukprot:XP_019853395.1 PREDICTED: uncharacterized protein LOC109582843 isoform X2 [Amphimedon queenslandica]